METTNLETLRRGPVELLNLMKGRIAVVEYAHGFKQSQELITGMIMGTFLNDQYTGILVPKDGNREVKPPQAAVVAPPQTNAPAGPPVVNPTAPAGMPAQVAQPAGPPMVNPVPVAPNVALVPSSTPIPGAPLTDMPGTLPPPPTAASQSNVRITAEQFKDFHLRIVETAYCYSVEVATGVRFEITQFRAIEDQTEGFFDYLPDNIPTDKGGTRIIDDKSRSLCHQYVIEDAHKFLVSSGLVPKPEAVPEPVAEQPQPASE